MFALGLFVAICVVTITAPLIATFVLHTDPNAQNLRNNFAVPSTASWLGTDELGRDNLTRRAVRRSSLPTDRRCDRARIAGGWRAACGLMAGFYGDSWTTPSTPLFRYSRTFQACSLLIILSVTFRPDVTTLAIIIGLTGWTGTARLGARPGAIGVPPGITSMPRGCLAPATPGSSSTISCPISSRWSPSSPASRLPPASWLSRG